MNPIQSVSLELQSLGIPHTVEHPGYIQINRPNHVQLAIGTCNDTWMIDVHCNGAFTPKETIDLRIPRDSQEFAIIADAIQNAIAEHNL